jgi:uncharacterized coiled-coil protein SlyX
MSSTILKGLAITAGLGLAVGLGSGKRRREENSMGSHLPDDAAQFHENGSSLEPVLERLSDIESRLSAVETRPSATTELDLQIQRQAQDIETLQLQVSEHRQKVAGEVATIEKRFADITRGIPAVLESIIVPRVDDLRVHLRSELQQSVNVTLTKFERAIDDKISDRISTLEKTMLDQSSIVTALSQRAVESDLNLQRLISAVERLCQRNNQNPTAQKEPSFLDLPFELQLKQPEIPVQPFESGFRPRIIKEDENDKQPRHRVPLTRL